MAVIVRYGEIALKGKNRGEFEKRLVKNIKACLTENKIKFKDVKRFSGRILIDTDKDCPCLERVYGITSFSHAIETELDIEAIKQAALSFYTSGTFGIKTQRIEKLLGTSSSINIEVGSFIVENTKAKVNLKEPNVTIFIEIFNKHAYIFNRKFNGPGGLPAGIEGKVAVLLEDNSSIDAALLMMKRGCEVILVKVNKIDYKTVKDYAYGFKLKVVDSVPGYVDAVVVSDTLENLKERDTKKAVLRPLIAR
jgi:thiamine biosynthesis protein ThiI